MTKQSFANGQTTGGGSNKYFYGTNIRNDICSVVDNSGIDVAENAYDAWGAQTNLSGSFVTDFGCAAMYLHAPSGVYLTAFRAYNSATGRWLSRDPLGERGDTNLYSYVFNSPLNSTDILGLGTDKVTNPYTGVTEGAGDLGGECFLMLLPAEKLGAMFGGFVFKLVCKLIRKAPKCSCPNFLYRTGSQTDNALTDAQGVSFRDSVSSSASGEQIFRPGEKIYSVDPNQLPPGSVVLDGVPPGHVSVNATPEEIRAAILKHGECNPLNNLNLKPQADGTSYRLPK